VSSIADFARDLDLGFRSRPARTALVFFPIVLGNFALALLIAVADGLAARADRLLREFGATTIVLIPARQAEEPALLPRRAANVLAANLPGAIVTGIRRHEVVSSAGDRVLLFATDAGLAAARGWPLRAGRFLDEPDERAGERHVVLCESLARVWKARPGSIVTLGDVVFRVVGVVASESNAPAEEAADAPGIALGERAVFVPWTAAGFVVSSAVEPGDDLDAIFIRLPSDRRFEASRQRLERLLSDPSLTGGPVARITPENVLRGVRRIRRAMDLGLGGVTALAFALGGAALAGLLAGNVRERVTEIGLRRAIGATRGDVAALFVTEGLVLALGAALTGVAFARGCAPVLARAGLPIAYGFRMVGGPVTGSALLGLLASLVPARMAARADPAAALRAE
jgi:ABC-type antimicrobial peptide transport system permease subunit